MNTTEDVFANRIGAAGVIAAGLGLYLEINTLTVIGAVVIGLWACRKYLLWKDEL